MSTNFFHMQVKVLHRGSEVFHTGNLMSCEEELRKHEDWNSDQWHISSVQEYGRYCYELGRE